MTRRTWTPEDIATLREMAAKGIPVPEIAAAFRISPSYLRVLASRHDIPLPRAQAAGSVARALGPSTEPLDLAAAIQRHRGVTAPHERPEAFVPPEAVPSVADSYDAFNELIMRIGHPPYQADVIRAILTDPQVALVKGRQIGATRYIIAPAVVYFSFTHPFATVLLTSLTMRQSAYLLNHIKNLIAGNRALKSSLVDVSQERIRLSNGTEILSLPSGVDGSSLRGYSPDLAIVDEAAFVPDRAIMDALLPSLAVTGGHLALVSTPWGIGSYFYRCARENPAYKVFTIPSSQSPFIPKGFLEARRLDTDPLSYRTEYEGDFVSTADAYFSYQSIKAALRDFDLRDTPREGDFSYFGGVDWGRKVDASVVAYVERDDSADRPHYRLIHLKEFFETPYTHVVGYVRNTSESFRAQEVLADSGAGLAQIDTLRELGAPVREFAFTNASKGNLMSNLKLLLENGQLDLPADERRLILQLSNFSYKITEAGNLRLAGKEDDLVDALALACYAAHREGGYGLAMDAMNILQNWGSLSAAPQFLTSDNRPLPPEKKEPKAICVCCKRGEDVINSEWLKHGPHEQFPPRMYWCPRCRPEYGCQPGGPHKEAESEDDESDGNGGLIV